MAVKILIPAVLLVLGLTAPGQDLPKFMGREVMMTVPELDADGFFPKGPASVCVEGPPQRQCFTAPKDVGKHPTVAAIQLEKDRPALFFSAEAGGVSGWEIHFFLLQPGTGKDLEDLFSDITVSNQSQHAFWNDSTISDAPIFLTAQYSWGPDDGHYGEHRYIVSVYVRRLSLLLNNLAYFLEDQYMTVRKYDLDANADVLTSEKQEILARLARVKAETERQKRTPR